MIRIDGKEVSKVRKAALAEKIKSMANTPGLAVVLVGDDPASQVYVGGKEKACKAVGINSFRHNLPANTSQEELHKLLDELNADHKVHGILVQFPLPGDLDTDAVLAKIDPKKDADGLAIENMGLHWAGNPRVISCTPFGVMKLLEHYDIPISGKRAVVVGRSNLVGKPMAQLLQTAGATVTVCHSKTPDTKAHTLEADIVVVAAGKPRFMGKDDFKKGAVVIDVGIHRDENNKLCGDVRFDELEGWASAATPVPGGVGPMTIAMLLENTVHLAELAD